MPTAIQTITEKHQNQTKQKQNLNFKSKHHNQAGSKESRKGKSQNRRITDQSTNENLISIDTIDGDEIDDDRLSLGGSSLNAYNFFFPLVPFLLESCDRGQGRSTPPDDISIYQKIILQILNQIEYWNELKLDN